MRLFIGIKLDNQAINKIKAIDNYLYSQSIRGNYTNYNNIHLTLIFLGEVKKENVNKIIEVANSIDTSNLKQITINEVVNFKEMIIAKVRKSQELDSVYNQLFEKLINLHYSIQNRPFFPHITLVRETNQMIGNVINKEIISGVSKVTLFESKRVNNELQYIPLN